MLWKASEWRPEWQFSWQHLSELLNFSCNILGFPLVNFFNQKTDSLLIGYFFGEVALGYYAIAQRILQVMIQLLLGRWLHECEKMIYAPEIIVYHNHDLTLPTFFRQHFNYGRGAFWFHKIRIKRTNESIKVEPLKFYIDLLIYPFMQKSSQPGILLLILFVISQVANVAGFFWHQWHQSAKK